MIFKRLLSVLTALCLLEALAGCSNETSVSPAVSADGDYDVSNVTNDDSETTAEIVSDKEYIEYTLNLANNTDYTWTYQESSSSWVMSIVSAVTSRRRYSAKPSHSMWI